MPGLVRSDYIHSLEVHNRHVTDEDARLMIADAQKENRAESSGWACCSSESTSGTEELRAIFEQHRDDFNADAQATVAQFLKSQRSGRTGRISHEEDGPIDGTGKSLVNSRAHHTTWTCDWFPMGIRANAPGINLFSEGGVCHKYDLATHASSRGYEQANHVTEGVSWSGHCDMAARVCSVLNQPVRSVEHNGVTFTPHDIQGLLVMVSNDLAGPNEPFIGSRNNGNAGDDPSEPYPHVLMPELIKWAKEKTPYVLDIDNGAQVWNYAYDTTEIKEFSSPQEGMRKISPMNGGKIKYQTWDLSGTGYDPEIRHYRSWIEYDAGGDKLASGWFGDPRDTKRNPDFAWKPVACGDLTRKENWPTACAYNPQIDPQKVYDIYRQSI